MSNVDINFIASIFLSRHSCSLTDTEIISEAKRLGVDLLSSRIKEAIHSMAPYLFRLEETEDGACHIFLESPVRFIVS